MADWDAMALTVELFVGGDEVNSAEIPVLIDYLK